MKPWSRRTAFPTDALRDLPGLKPRVALAGHPGSLCGVKKERYCPPTARVSARAASFEVVEVEGTRAGPKARSNGLLKTRPTATRGESVPNPSALSERFPRGI